MTSQQDTELEKILDEFFDLPYPDYNMGLLPDEEGYDVVQERRNYEEGYVCEEIVKVFISWKDKEVQKAKLRLINTEIRKLQKNEVWYRFDDCVWELKQTRKRITKSLQSQGGKNE